MNAIAAARSKWLCNNGQVCRDEHHQGAERRSSASLLAVMPDAVPLPDPGRWPPARSAASVCAINARSLLSGCFVCAAPLRGAPPRPLPPCPPRFGWVHSAGQSASTLTPEPTGRTPPGPVSDARVAPANAAPGSRAVPLRGALVPAPGGAAADACLVGACAWAGGCPAGGLKYALMRGCPAAAAAGPAAACRMAACPVGGLK